MAKYLDSDGLLFFWQKIKNTFALAGHTHATVNGHTVNADVPSDAKFTDTTYKAATSDTLGLVKVGANITNTSGSISLTKANVTAALGYTPPTTNTTYSNATTSNAGLMSAEDKVKLNGLESTYAKKSDIAGAYIYKGSVDTEAKLPTTGQKTGDVYNVVAASSYGAAGANVAWNGSAWDSLGEIFSISSATNAEIDTIVAS